MLSNTLDQRSEIEPHPQASGADVSNSSSAESLRRELPNTPPQIQLNHDAVAIADGTAFSDFFPWIKHEGNGSGDLKETDAPTALQGGTLEPPGTEHKSASGQTDYISAFEQRSASHLSQISLLAPHRTGAGGSLLHTVSTIGINSPNSSRPDSRQEAAESRLPIPREEEAEEDHIASSRYQVLLEQKSETTSSGDNDNASGSSQPFLPLNPTHLAVRQTEKGVSQHTSNSSHPRTVTALSTSSPQLSRSPSLTASSRHEQTGVSMPDIGAPGLTSPEDACCTGDVVLDMYEDDKLPGYQVRKRGTTNGGAMAVRIPRQMMGWKAVLMDTSGFTSNTSSSKKARRASKVLGKQGWEVRQEALKNSYDFRQGSGIWATMHAGHRLFKHDWHIIVKDGSRYVWRMDKHALALYREDDSAHRVAEFCRSVPSGSASTNDAAARLLDETKRIGSFRFAGELGERRSPDHTVFGSSLALASLIAIFGARGGHGNVSAAFEPSSDPLRKVLERRRRETPDREEVMLALPRPGFARDTESMLSDTTDEDAGSPTSKAIPERGHYPHSSNQQISASQFVEVGLGRAEEQRSSGARTGKGHKRFSSFFSNSARPAHWMATTEAEDTTMTPSQRIARRYRTQSMIGSSL